MPPAWPIKTKQFTVQTSITQTLHIVEIIKNSTLKNSSLNYDFCNSLCNM